MLALHRLSILLSLQVSSHIMTKTSSLVATAPRRSTRLRNQNNGIADSGKNQLLTKSIRKRSASSSTLLSQKKAARTNENNVSAMPPLLNIANLVKGIVAKRPSATIKSPYVADVALDDSTTALAHATALDCAGMCMPGKEVMMSTRKPGGKTSHAIELVVSDAQKNTNERVLVGAHPRLGELIAEEVLKRGLLADAISLNGSFKVGPVTDSTQANKKSQDQTISLKQQVTLGDSRVDFEMTITNKETSHRVIFEVKNVVCADYEKGTEPIKLGANHCVVVAESNNDTSYQRTALFPWAKSRSQTFENKKVCSERALKHLRNCYDLATERVTPVVLFIVNRSDCESVRACHEACPVFRDVLEEVTRDGVVKALGVRVRWTENGGCYFDGIIPVKS